MNLEKLIRMTPLSWRATEERALDIGIDEITVEFTVINGKNGNKKNKHSSNLRIIIYLIIF